jgi:hypothetical protein
MGADILGELIVKRPVAGKAWMDVDPEAHGHKVGFRDRSRSFVQVDAMLLE